MPLDRQAVDDEDATLPHDHPGLLDEDTVIRLIPKQWCVPGSTPGTWRLSSQTFENSSDKYGGCSVLLSKLLGEQGADVDDIVQQRKMAGAISLPVSLIRANGLRVGFDPLPDDPFHGQIWNKITRGISKKLLGGSAWAVEIPNTSIT